MKPQDCRESKQSIRRFDKHPLTLLKAPTRYLFFTGKGGVGKTSLSTAVALTLADTGRRVLLVSTDAASNLDDMLGIELRNTPTSVPGAPGLMVLNIDPDAAAESYRQRVLSQMAVGTSESELATVREELSGACTTEIASFDEFASLLSDNAEHYDHVVFDTAPTGHTSACSVFRRHGVDSWKGTTAVRPASALTRGSRCRKYASMLRSTP